MFKLRDYQIKAQNDIRYFLKDSSFKKGLMVLPTGCHAEGYDILRSNGSVAKVEDIVVGDSLLGPDGNYREVLELIRGKGRMYEVYLEDNTLKPFVVNYNHVIPVFHDKYGFQEMTISDLITKYGNNLSEFSMLRCYFYDNDLRTVPIKAIIKLSGKRRFYGFKLTGDHLYVDYQGLVHHNCGKSLIVSLIAQQCNENILVIQPSKELLEQNYEKALAFGLKPTIYSASKNKKEISQLTYATIGSIRHKPEEFMKFNYVIIDEAHVHLSQKVTRGRVSNKGLATLFLDKINPKKVIGLTATPIQLVSSKGLSQLKMLNRSMRSYWYKSELFHVTQVPDICNEDGAEISLTHIIPKDTQTLQYNSAGSDFTEESVAEWYNVNEIENQILKQYYNLLDQGINSILTFVPTVDQAIALSQQNPDFAVVHANTPPKEREYLIREFKAGNIKMMINCQTLQVGFDFPELQAVIIARETASFALFAQIAGRVVRPIVKDGNVERVTKRIIDLTTNTTRFGDIRSITIENNDYTHGWAMWSGDKLLTGVPNKGMDFTRDFVMEDYAKVQLSRSKRVIYKDIDAVMRAKVIEDYNKMEHKFEDVVITFGKYKGKRISYVYKNDPQYLAWMAGIKPSRPEYVMVVKNVNKLLYELTSKNDF